MVEVCGYCRLKLGPGLPKNNQKGTVIKGNTAYGLQRL
jgi:hypothetical protein